ncbi:DUF2637 domain-containing protein [Streptomyces sp. NPDC091201]|uniref:DUF2637 domain-containing protein n=1 Tax=Streptomyces sp. NPDC091201 TaxID=3155190 RepID=UPI00341ECA67
MPALTRGERVLVALAGLGAIGVSGLGLAASYKALSAVGAEWGFDYPWMVPVGIDVAIPAFSLAHLILIRMGMPLSWVRFVPWALTAVTCWLNVAAGQTLTAKIAHGTMPLLWVVFAEIVAHVYAVRIGQATGRRMDKTRRSRWLLSPVSTFFIWRRMILWEITDYDQALALERARQLEIADLKEEHGWRWRSKMHARQRVLLRMGAVTPAAAEVPTATVTDAAAPEEAPDAVLPTLAAPAVPAQAAVPARLPVPRQQITATIAPADPPVPAEPASAVEQPVRPASDGEHRAPITEADLYAIVKAAIQAGESERFEQGGDLSGTAMGRALGHTAGNGRKVRKRLLNTYAAETGIEVPAEFNVEDLVTATAAGARKES